MYLFTMSAVESVRELTGAPNDPKWNSVLFGGKKNKSHHLY